MFGGPCLIVQIDRQVRPAAESAAVGRVRTAPATVTFAQEEAFWKEIASVLSTRAESVRGHHRMAGVASDV